MRSISLFALLTLASAGCGKKAPPAAAGEVAPDPQEAAEPAPAPNEERPPVSGLIRIDSGGALAGADGARVALSGTLVRATPGGGDQEGTAIELGDGALVFVTWGEPPEGWDWMLGSPVRLEGTLLEQAKEDGRPAVPVVIDYDAPMPGGMGPTMQMPPME